MKHFGKILFLFVIVSLLGACRVETTPGDLTLLPAAEEVKSAAKNETEPPTEVEAEPVAVEEAEPEALKEAESMASEDAETAAPELTRESEGISEDGYYYDLESVVRYYDRFGTLPDNYITKIEARKLGWEGGRIDDYMEGAAIGGDRFGNYEKSLPQTAGTKYIECDIDTKNRSRGSKRLVISNTGRYYYTADHYETFREVIIKDGEVVFADD